MNFYSFTLRLVLSCTYVFLLTIVYNIVSSAKLRILKLLLFCKSLINIKNNKGPMTEPYGIPTQVHSYPSKLTNCFLSPTYDFNNKDIFPLVP